MSNDTVDGTVGREADGVVVGKGNTQQSNRAGDINFSNNENAIWFKLLEMAADIRDLAFKLDDLPNRVRKLEAVEVVVKPGPEVVIRSHRQEKSLTDRMLMIILVVMLVAVLAVVATFIYWVVGHA